MNDIRKLPPIYKDIDLSFNVHPVTGDLSKKINKEAITQAIRLLILSMSEEILWEPELGGNITKALFRGNDPLFRMDIQNRIGSIIKQREPRVELKNVLVYQPEGNPRAVKCRIEFYFMNVEDPFIEDLYLFRVR